MKRPRLHKQVTEATLRNKPIRQMLRGSGIRFIQGCVTAIDAKQLAVTITGKSDTQ